MKLTGAAAITYFGKPDPDSPGLLIYGRDAMRVALRRQEVILALIGPEGEGEMRLTRLSGAELRKNPAALPDAVKSPGFFPGPRVVFVEEATDTVLAAVTTALRDWRPGDACLVITGNLTTKSTLVKLFDGHPMARSAGIYDDPPSRAEIEAMLQKSGLGAISPEAMNDLLALARDLDPGDFRQTVEKIALYKWGEDTPLKPADIAEMAPATMEAEVDDVLNAVAERRPAVLGPLMRRLEGQGIGPVTLCIGAMKHFRTLHLAASDPGGPAQGVQRMRPPVFGPRRDRLIRQAGDWRLNQIEDALRLIVETDLTLRSASRAPAMAVMERTLMRLAMTRR